ncbi:hypothetical protein F4680DRAFT_463340 [Xylaria scruposa]|nr:hypothetical protein F4680DRAFT_463340 [Xylaria scruposa]
MPADHTPDHPPDHPPDHLPDHPPVNKLKRKGESEAEAELRHKRRPKTSERRVAFDVGSAAEVEKLKHKLLIAEERALTAEERVINLKEQLETANTVKRVALKQLERTTLTVFLANCHRIFVKPFKLAEQSILSNGLATDVTGRRYPMWLHPWTSFPELGRQYYEMFDQAFDNQRLFDQTIVTEAAIEKHIDRYSGTAIEFPVREILKALLKVHPASCNNTELSLSLNPLEIAACQTEIAPSQSQKDKRKSRKRKIESKEPGTIPDGLGFIKPEGGAKTLAFVYDYKAALKLKDEDLKIALNNEKLFMEVIEQINGNKLSTDTQIKDKARGDQQVAMALAQVYNYMIHFGLEYGYVNAGTALVFLHIDYKKRKQLQYHLCLPDKKTDVKESETLVAQLAMFCLHAIHKSKLLERDAFKKAKKGLPRWPTPYKHAHKYIETEESSQSQSSAGNAGPAVASNWNDEEDEDDEDEDESSEEEDEGIEDSEEDEEDSDDGESDYEDNDNGNSKDKNSDNDSPRDNHRGSSGGSSKNNHRKSSNSGSLPARKPTREYCTQACLMGLTRGSPLDKNCPNVSLHCAGKRYLRSESHPIDKNQFIYLVQEQLSQNQYYNCVALDPSSVEGKNGSIGALFKIELAHYGYTFVAKGTRSANLHCLKHESEAYLRLRPLQGEKIPVYLGMVSLPKHHGYDLPGRPTVVHMMFMSWVGEVATESDASDLSHQVDDLYRIMLTHGVEHDDLRMPNILWSREHSQVMIVDFDRSFLLEDGRRQRQRS